ncbi:MAG: hypothetical protein P8Y71_15990, partial [Pseudolabrys sp.]
SVGKRGWIEDHCSSLSQKRLDRIASLRIKHPERISNWFTATILLGLGPSSAGDRAAMASSGVPYLLAPEVAEGR